MQQFDISFIQTLNKFRIVTKNVKDIQSINSMCN